MPAGDDVVPHPCIGRARRVMVPNSSPGAVAAAMLFAVENLSPQVIIVDELGSAEVGRPACLHAWLG